MSLVQRQFSAAEIFTTNPDGGFGNVRAFCALEGFNPAIPSIIGDGARLVMIQSNGPSHAANSAHTMPFFTPGIV